MPEVPLTVIPCFPALVCRLLPESSIAFPLNGISFTPSRKVSSPEGQPVVAKSQHCPPTPPQAFCSLTEKNQDQDKWRPLKKGLLAEQKGLRLALLPEPLDLDSASDHLSCSPGFMGGVARATEGNGSPQGRTLETSTSSILSRPQEAP